MAAHGHREVIRSVLWDQKDLGSSAGSVSY